MLKNIQRVCWSLTATVLLGACGASQAPEVVQAKPASQVVHHRWGHPLTKRDSVVETRGQLGELIELVDEYGRPSGTLPATLSEVVEGENTRGVDLWGRRIRYATAGLRFELRSAGSDGGFETDDDVVAFGQLGRRVPCEIQDEYRVWRPEEFVPLCAADAPVLVTQLCPALLQVTRSEFSSYPWLEFERPETARDSAVVTGRTLVRLAREIEGRGREVGGVLPMLRAITSSIRLDDVWVLRDLWLRPMRYVPQERSFELRSAGSDAEFDTADDIVIEAWLGRTIPCEFRIGQEAVSCDDPPPDCPEGPVVADSTNGS